MEEHTSAVQDQLLHLPQELLGPRGFVLAVYGTMGKLRSLSELPLTSL